MQTKMICDLCGESIMNGYGTYNGLDLCYACCAEVDKRKMKTTNKYILYFDSGMVINWPGTLRIPVIKHKIGRHNLAGTRDDVWFLFDGSIWHGVCYGPNTQLLHCKRTKKLC